MNDNPLNIDRDKKADHYRDEYLTDAHKLVGDATRSLLTARSLCVGGLGRDYGAVHAIACRAQELDRDIGYLIDALYPGRQPEDDDEAP